MQKVILLAVAVFCGFVALIPSQLEYAWVLNAFCVLGSVLCAYGAGRAHDYR